MKVLREEGNGYVCGKSHKKRRHHCNECTDEKSRWGGVRVGEIKETSSRETVGGQLERAEQHSQVEKGWLYVGWCAPVPSVRPHRHGLSQ